MRRKFIPGLLVLLFGIPALWFFFVLTDSRKYVGVDLVPAGTTNSAGQQFVLFRLTNSGTKAIVWNGAFVPWECRAETKQGWTNFGPRYFSGGGWLLPATNLNFSVVLPEETRRWQIGVAFEEASPRMEWGVRTYRLKLMKWVPDFVWQLIPGTPGKYHELWTEVFTNVPGTSR